MRMLTLRVKVSETELGIRVIDTKTLEITLSNPKPYFLDMLVRQSFRPVPVHTIEKYGQVLKTWLSVVRLNYIKECQMIN